MKELSLSVVGVSLLALGLGLLFHWVYPLVSLSGEVIGLFVFVAVALKLLLSKLWSLWQARRVRLAMQTPVAHRPASK